MNVIGESLLPAMRKRGGTFRRGSSPEPWSFAFAVSPRIAGPTSHAFQVERMKFAEIPLKHACKVDASGNKSRINAAVGGGRVYSDFVDPESTRARLETAMELERSGTRPMA